MTRINLKLVIIALLLLYFPCRSYAQYTIQGKVINNTTKEVLPFANIQVKQIGKTIAFGSSTHDGAFSISISQKDSLLLKISYIGFESNELQLVIPKDQQRPFLINIYLTPTSNTLDDVVIKGEAPSIKVRQDTIIYNIEKYTDGSELSLGELLNKLPGIEVEKGTIKVNGEKIDKLLMDGEEFFINQHQLATENIDSKLVDGIEFYSNYEDLSAFKNFNTNRVKALNIGIKEEYKNKITGNISVAAGVRNKYHGHTNLFRFGKKTNLSFIGDVNNTGQKSFTFLDYLNTIDPSQFSSNGTATLDIGKGLNSLLLAEDNVARRETKLGTINISIKPTPHLKIYFYSILSHLKQNINSSSTRTLFSIDQPIIHNNQQKSTNNSIINSSYLNIDYKANDNTLLKYTLNVSPYSHRSDISTVNMSTTGSQFFNDNDDNTPFSFNHRLVISKKLSSKILLTTFINQRIDQSKNKKNLNSTTPFLNLPFSSTNYSVEQLTNENENNTEGNISISYKVAKNIFKLEVGGSLSKNNFSSSLFEIDPNMSKSEVNDNQFRNNTLINRRATYIGGFINKSSGLLQYRLGASTNAFLLNIEQSSSDEFKTIKIFPTANVMFRFRETNKLTLGYEKGNTLSNASNVSFGTIIDNFQQLSSGNTPFNNISESSTISLKHHLLDLFSNTIFITYSSFTTETNFTSYNTISQENYSFSQKRIAPNKHSFRASIFLDKTIRLFPAKFRLIVNYHSNKFYSFVENQQTRNKSQNLSLKPTITSLFKSSLNFESGFELMKASNTVTLIGLNNSFVRLSPYIKLKQKFDSGLLIRINFKYDQYSTNTGLKRELYLLDGMIKYRGEKNRVEYTIKANNILNLNTNQRLDVSLNNNYLQERIYSSLPGYLLFEVKYNL